MGEVAVVRGGIACYHESLDGTDDGKEEVLCWSWRK
jgi:hypothetical protein